MRKTILQGFLVAAIAGLVAVPAAAQTQVNQRAPKGSGIQQFLEASPQVVEAVVDKGASTRQTVRIKNKHVSAVRLRATVENILPDGESGAVRPVTEPTRNDLRKYATVTEPEFTLRPQESREVSVNLRMGDAPAGGYYGMVRFTQTERTDLPPLALEGYAGSLVLIRVAGQVPERGVLEQVTLERPGGGHVGIVVLGTDLTVGVRIKNEGETLVKTAPVVRSSSPKNEVKADEGFILPGATRVFEVPLKDLRTARQTVSASVGLPGGDTQRTATTWSVTPRDAAIGVPVLLIVTGVLLRYAWRRRARKHTRL